MAHNLFALGGTSLCIVYLAGKGPGFAWASGYVTHLLGDLPFSWDMPWFFPFDFGAMHNSVEGVLLNMSRGEVVMDMFFSGTALCLIVRDWWRRRFWKSGSFLKALSEEEIAKS